MVNRSGAQAYLYYMAQDNTVELNMDMTLVRGEIPSPMAHCLHHVCEFLALYENTPPFNLAVYLATSTKVCCTVPLYLDVI